MAKLNWSSFNAKAPKPGGDRSVGQHKAAAMGYSVEPSSSSVETHQKSFTTGCSHAPGMTKGKR